MEPEGKQMETGRKQFVAENFAQLLDRALQKADRQRRHLAKLERAKLSQRKQIRLMREVLLAHLLEFCPREKVFLQFGPEGERIECLVSNQATSHMFYALKIKGPLPVARAESMLGNVKAQNRQK